ncbi:MAG: DMT family transporter [Nitratireductor sp.]|nr:DMT family transporter [Nitratireductor sp.]
MTLFRWLWQQPYLLLTLAALSWGANAVAGKLAVGHVSPFLLTLSRWVFLIALLVPFALPGLRRDWPVIRSRLPFLFLLGAIGFTLFNNIFYSAAIHTTALNLAIIQAGMPLCVFLFNLALFGIRTTPLQAFGYAITLAGVLLTASHGSLERLATLSFNHGDILMLAAIAAYGLYSVLLKNKPAMHWMSFIFILAASAALVAIPFAAYEARSSGFIFPDTQGWAVIAFSVVVPSFIAQVVWIRGIEIVGANSGGVFINLVPVFGAFLAVLILGEEFRLYHALALSLVLGGVWIAQKKTA